MRKTLPDIFGDLLVNPTADFTQQEAQSYFGSYFSYFTNLGLLTPSLHRKWLHCLSCGQTHELADIDGIYWLICPDDGIGAEAINADQLRTVGFNQPRFYSWLQSQFSLQGTIEASDDKVSLGQGIVKNTKRLFIFSRDNSPQAREKLYWDHPVNQAVILYLNPSLDSHKGYDINLVEYLALQENNLIIDVNSALSVITDTVLPLLGDVRITSSNYAVELKLQGNEIIVTGTALSGSYPAFKKKRTSVMSRLFSTLLRLHKDEKETLSKTYKQDVLEASYIDPRKNKKDDLAKIDINQSKRSLSDLGSSLLSHFLTVTHRDHPTDGFVVEFKPALSQEDWNKLSDPEKQKILSSKAI